MILFNKVIINCASSSVTAAVFVEVNKKIVLKRFINCPLPTSLKKPQGRNKILAIAIQKVFAPLKAEGYKEVHLIISGADLLTKSFKIPHATANKLRQMITFEAQEQIPYKLNEVIWDSFIASDDGVEMEVILVAAKKDFIQNLSESVAQQGVFIENITAGPILDYYALKATQTSIDTNTLLIDIGSTSSNFSFIDTQGLIVRNVGYGCDNINQEIADNLDITLQKANALRVNISRNPNGTSTPKEKEVYEKACDNYNENIAKEITRSALSYLQKRRKKLGKILLDGGGSLSKNLTSYLTDRTKIPTEIFNSSTAYTIDPSLKSEHLLKNPYLLTETLGLLQLSIEKGKVINLLPSGITREIQFSRKKLCLFLTIAVLSLTPLAPALHYHQQLKNLQEENQTVIQQIKQKQDIQLTLDRFSQSIEANIKKTQAVQNIQQNKSNWILFLADLQNLLQNVEDTWLVDLRIERNRRQTKTSNTQHVQNLLHLSGNLLIRDSSVEEASKRVDSLIQSFKNSEFINDIKDHTLDLSDKRIIKFQFTVSLNPQKPL